MKKHLIVTGTLVGLLALSLTGCNTSSNATTSSSSTSASSSSSSASSSAVQAMSQLEQEVEATEPEQEYGREQQATLLQAGRASSRAGGEGYLCLVVQQRAAAGAGVSGWRALCATLLQADATGSSNNKPQPEHGGQSHGGARCRKLQQQPRHHKALHDQCQHIS